MTSTQGGSTVARRQLGRRLRALRMGAGKTHEDLSESRVISRTKIWKLETGRVPAKDGDVLALARFYGARPDQTDELMALAWATRETGPAGKAGSAITPWFGEYAELEASCATLRAYNGEMVLGLLQTEAYARAVISAGPDLPSPDVVEQRVAFRMARQRSFQGRSGRVDFVTTAGALQVLVDSPAVMEAQIAHLRGIASRETVSVRVLLATSGAHAAMGNTFMIMDFDDPDDPSLVYLESMVGSHYVERPEQVTRFRQAFERVRAQAVPLEDFVR
jgi:transcriptional regulator with XRE-family HTH domain